MWKSFESPLLSIPHSLPANHLTHTKSNRGREQIQNQVTNYQFTLLQTLPNSGIWKIHLLSGKFPVIWKIIKELFIPTMLGEIRCLKKRKTLQ